MKKYTFLFALALCFSSASIFAQKITGCGFKVPPRSLITKFQSVYEARDILKNMLDTIQWKENFNIREQNGIRNAYATIINQQRWIVYDNDFLEDLDAYTSTKWASISVLAHEMGHHYYNHVVSSTGSTPPKEIEADAFSGYVMAKLGATLEQSIAAMKAIATDQGSSSHPGKTDRVNAITKGWNAAKASVANNPNNLPGNTNPAPDSRPAPSPGYPSPVPPTNSGNTSTPQNDPSWIALTVQSNKTETVLLSDDGRNFQQVQIPAGQAFVFKFEIYSYGWLRLKYFNGYRTFKLRHGKDYSILWNRRGNNWTVVEVPE